MTEKIITCTTCPLGCEITVRGEGENILSMTGQGCPRGETYAAAEFVHPVRILTSSVKLEGGKEPLVPVRSSAPLPKELLLDCMAVIRETTVKAPVSGGTVVIPNILGTGVDIMTTGDGMKEA